MVTSYIHHIGYNFNINLKGVYMMQLTVYLAGQIHDQWREIIKKEAKKRELPIIFVGPQENHDRSDSIGEAILGEQPSAIYKDEAASQINNLRTTVLMNKADVVIAQFGDKYRQWNAAMDVATAIEKGKPVIIIRPIEIHHALKELSNKAQVVVENPLQALDALAYIFE
jgi:YtoQ family protein